MQDGEPAHTVNFFAMQRPGAMGRSLVDEHVKEIALLTEMVWERDRMIASLEQRNDWLTRFAMMTLNGLSRGWGRFMPGLGIKRRLLSRLERRGMFDCARYLVANPDVAADGIDPLRHYVFHGLPEGRPSGLSRGDRT